MTAARSRSLAAVLLLYVLPLGLTAAYLAHVGLGLLAVALLAVEGAVVAAVALARARPPRRSRPRSGSATLLAVGALVVVATAVLLAVVPR